MYHTYVTDSLFFLQQLNVGGGEKQVFSMKMSEIIEMSKNPRNKEEPEDIISRIKNKADNLRGNEE